MIAALALLSALLLARSGSSEASGDGEAAREGPGGGSEDASPARVPAPEDLSFLCDDLSTASTSEDARLDAGRRDEAEAAAGGFVTAAYGYAGADAEAYEGAVEGRVVGDCFWPSAAGDEVGGVEEVVRRGGEANAPEDHHFAEAFVGFYVTSKERVRHEESGAEYLRVHGDAVWVSRKARAAVGEEDALRGAQQGLTLAKKVGEDQWKVVEGQMVSFYPSSDYEHAVDEKVEEIEHGG